MEIDYVVSPQVGDYYMLFQKKTLPGFLLTIFY